MIISLVAYNSGIQIKGRILYQIHLLIIGNKLQLSKGNLTNVNFLFVH